MVVRLSTFAVMRLMAHHLDSTEKDLDRKVEGRLWGVDSDVSEALEVF